MKRDLGDWADLMFNPDHNDLAHIVPFGQQYSLCGGQPLGTAGWWGTGDMDEIEQARAMPVCPSCSARIPVLDDQQLPA